MKRILIETDSYHGIPYLTMVKEMAIQCPVVIYAHGFDDRKENGLDIGYQLAEAGFFFVSPDAPMHGERPDARLRHVSDPQTPHIYPPESGLDAFLLMHEIIVQMAIDIDRLIDHFSTDSRADMNRLGITRVSMGGFLTFYMAANDPRVKVAVPMVGIPSFTERWQDVVLEASSYQKWHQIVEAAQEQTAHKTDLMRSIDPFEKLSSFPPKALLMINGDQDTASPKSYSVRLYRQLIPLYQTCPERLRLNIYDGVAHNVITNMLEDACAWFEKFI